jgi:hypothetical protein
MEQRRAGAIFSSCPLIQGKAQAPRIYYVKQRLIDKRLNSDCKWLAIPTLVYQGTTMLYLTTPVKNRKSKESNEW